jgi:hypothetical protein
MRPTCRPMETRRRPGCRRGWDEFPAARRASSKRGRERLRGRLPPRVLCGVHVLLGEEDRRERCEPGERWLGRRPVRAGSAAPRTNVLPRCPPVKRFPNEFSTSVSWRPRVRRCATPPDGATCCINRANRLRIAEAPYSVAGTRSHAFRESVYSYIRRSARLWIADCVKATTFRDSAPAQTTRRSNRLTASQEVTDSTRLTLNCAGCYTSLLVLGASAPELSRRRVPVLHASPLGGEDNGGTQFPDPSRPASTSASASARCA